MLSILKLDYRGYFTSPIGYIYIGAYIFVLNLMFYLNNALGRQASLSENFGFMLLVMMFTTPILTMRVFSEELKQKTDQLLLTAPIKPSSIVLGKFFSSFSVFLTLLALTLMWPAAISILGENNMAEVIGNYAGIICVGAAYIAMGVFISSLTENQVVAAIGSLGLFIALWLLEIISSYFYSTGALPVWIMSVLRFLSIFGRYSVITRGLLAFNDIVFYISVCAVFVFMTVRKLEKRR